MWHQLQLAVPEHNYHNLANGFMKSQTQYLHGDQIHL